MQLCFLISPQKQGLISSRTGASCTWVFEASYGRTVSVERLQSSQEIIAADILVLMDRRD